MTWELDRRAFLLGSVGSTAVVLNPSRVLAQDEPIAGLIRVCGSTQMRPLIETWARAFTSRHPGTSFAIDLQGTSTAQFGLHMNTADIALSGRQIYPYEYYGIYRRSQLLTVEIPVAIGSHDHIGQSSALAVFVHRDNPLAALSLPRLDRIFGAERAGGWQRMEWNTKIARGADSNIRTWGQLGLAGEWVDKPIIPYGPPALHPGGISFFQSRVMGGADVWNEQLREYPDRHEMMHDLAGDRLGIGYASLGYAVPKVKHLALSERDNGPYVRLTAETVAAGTYPLLRYAYAYLAPDTVAGDPAALPRRIQAFLTFVVSREGQRMVDGTGYHALPPSLAIDQVRSLTINALPKQAATGAD